MTPSLRSIVLLAYLPWLLGVDLLQSKSRPVEEGNTQMKAGKAEEALARYDKAAGRLPNDPGVRFNRGTALYALGRYEEAAQEFLRATEARAGALRATAFYNRGNSFFQLEKFGEAVESYKRSLMLNPADQRAKWNLELALQKKRDQDDKKKNEQDKPPEDKNQNDQNQNDQNKPEDQKSEDQKPEDQKPEDQKQNPEQKGGPEGKPEDQKPEDQNQGPNQKPEDQNPEKKPDQPPPPGAGGEPPRREQDGDQAKAAMNEIDAVLDSLERSPKALEKERARLRAVRRRPPVKDW